jgi:ADP-heptose:LPS heptosyltransferase
MAGTIPMKALQRADKALGACACALLQPLRWVRALRRRPRDPRRVLLIKFWGIGSLQLLTPAVKAIRARRPGAELVFLTLSANRECAEGLGVFDRVVTLDVAAVSWGGVFARILRLAGRLRAERFDEVFDFEFFTRFSAVVSVLTGARRTHGFGSTRVWRGRLHTDVVPFNRYWHVARNFRVLAGGEDGHNVVATDLEPVHFTPRDDEAVDALLDEVGLPGSAFAVLNPNAGTLSLERRWPPARFVELARQLAREDGLPALFIGAKSECEYTEGIALAAADAGATSVAGRLTTGMLAALLARAGAVVSNDSGPMHLAAALGAPTVGLFGPETPVMYAPLGVTALALYRPPACSPCINVHENKVASCIYGEPQCLMNIEVDEVLDAVRAARRGETFELHPQTAPSPAPSSEDARETV